MKLFNDLYKKSKALCEQLMPSIFDSDNSVSDVEQLLNSTENTSKIFNDNKDSECLTSLSDAPNIDYYMDPKEVKGEKKIEKEENTEYTQEPNTCNDTVGESNIEKSCNNQLMYELPTLLEELNNLYSQTTDENVISTIQFCESRIKEMMLACGCKSINEDSSFDNSRHVPHPFSFVQNGCLIEKTIKPGLIYKNKVLVKAIVKCKQ